MSWFGFEKIAPITLGISISCMVISRAPTLVSEFSALGLKFNINAGYIVVFSVPVIFLLMVWLWVFRDASIIKKAPFDKNMWLIYLLLFFPVFAEIFMFVQFLTVFSPSGECSSFSSLRYIWDFSLWEMKPEYCFSSLDKVQKYMPYIYPPIQTWLYFCFVLVVVFLSIKLTTFYKTNI